MPPRQGGSPAPTASTGATSIGAAAANHPDVSSLRSATNLRTVTRNDPAVAEILDTSTYSVIYHYEANDGKWQKQKQEGSLFVVRRTKAPEHALFMLNRQTVKNVTIPLIPGEMKASIIDANMLQVARRGEKIRYGIWFTEAADVPRFRETIVRVCGEPTKPAARASPLPAAAAAASTPPAAAAPTAAPTEDGFSRLFAGLTTVSAQPKSASPPAAGASEPAVANYAMPHPDYPQRGVQTQPIVPPTAAGTQSGKPETVDDLLMSILGNSRQPSAPNSAPLSPTKSSNPMPPASPTRQPPPQQQQPQPQQPPVNGGAPPGLYGGYPPMPGPVGPYPNLPPGYGPPPPPPNAIQLGPARDALAGTLPPNPQLGRHDLAGLLVHLLQTDERFGDEVYRAYRARCGLPP